MMNAKTNLLVFGSTRGKGLKVVEQALATGYEVTAFALESEQVNVEHSNLRIVRGDVLDLNSVRRAVPNHDAVFSSIGLPPTSWRDNVRSEGTRNIILAMEEAGVRRLISVTTLGIGDTRVMLPFLYKYILVPIFLRHIFTEHEIQENYIKQSRLDWTIVRPATLTNGEHSGSYRHGFRATERNLKNKISRADVADFMLKQLNENTYVRRSPGISY